MGGSHTGYSGGIVVGTRPGALSGGSDGRAGGLIGIRGESGEGRPGRRSLLLFLLLHMLLDSDCLTFEDRRIVRP